MGVVDVMQRVTFAMPPKPVPAPTSMWAFDADNFDGDPLRRMTTMECGPFAQNDDPEHDDFAPPSDADNEYERIRVYCAELTAPAVPTEIMQPIDTRITGTN